MDAEPLRLSGLLRLLLGLLYIVPKNVISRLGGRFASLRLPGPLQRAEIRLFARIAEVDLAEAKDPIESHDSLQSFFLRALCDDARHIDGDSMTLIAPCDGTWGEAGRIESGTLLQVKGRPYSVADLLRDHDLALRYEGGCFATFYLAPRDYHRFHTPIAGRFSRIDHWPGSLWPVNAIGLLGVERLFTRNERICAFLDVVREGDGDGDGDRKREDSDSIVLVAVGATMVGSVRLVFDDLTTNRPGARPESRKLGDDSPRFERGEEWGHFEFGSTIVLLTPPGSYVIEPKSIGSTVRLGEAIGRCTDS